MGRRFSRLDYALRLLQNPTTVNDPGVTPAQPPAGSALDEYNKYVSRQKQVTYNRNANSRPIAFDRVGVRAFGINPASGNEFVVYGSRRSLQEKTNVAGTSLNHLASIDGVVENPALVPAKAIIFVPAGTTTTVETSKITGIPYQKKSGASYTLPFGAAATGDAAFELGARSAIVTAAVAANTTASVSFEPEHFRG